MEDKEMGYWEKEEASYFLEVAKEDKNYIFFLLALSTGMRPGEILGLKWRDIDPDNQQLSVLRSLTRQGELKQPKTKSSRRMISLGEDTLSTLKSHRTRQKEEKMKAGKAYDDQNFVIATKTGNPVLYRNILRTWYRLTKPLFDKGELTPIRLYDMRHTHASLLLRENVHPKIVSERLGHASIKITLDTYSHVIPSLQKEAADKFNNALFG
ncbi:site-specific integrase [Salibacterium sp. K-3]